MYSKIKIVPYDFFTIWLYKFKQKKMKPNIAICGLTHLGLVYAAIFSEILIAYYMIKIEIILAI